LALPYEERYGIKEEDLIPANFPTLEAIESELARREMYLKSKGYPYDLGNGALIDFTLLNLRSRVLNQPTCVIS
jgi:molybdopterin converting factor small subunit